MSDFYGRWKERARWYVEGSKKNNGYGLSDNLSDWQLYEAANNLLLNGNFLYAGDVSEPIVTKFVLFNLHQYHRSNASLARLCSVTRLFTFCRTTISMKLLIQLRTPLVFPVKRWK